MVLLLIQATSPNVMLPVSNAKMPETTTVRPSVEVITPFPVCEYRMRSSDAQQRVRKV
jgi:hypothetical protein